MSVQSHTWDHVYLNWLSDHAIDTETRRTSRAITAALGASRCLRPPYGAINSRVERRLARDGMVPVTWDVDPHDWKHPGTRKIVTV